MRSKVARSGWAVLLLLLMAYAVLVARADLPYQYGFDLYHPWGIRAAKEALAPPVNPYADTVRVGAFVFDLAGESPSLTLQAASGFWKLRNATVRFEPTGTPLYYALLGFMPRDYDTAHALLMALQIAAVVAGVLLLARLRGGSTLASLCVAVLVCATFNPFVEDVKFGNVNSLQFLGLAAFIAMAHGGFERSRAIDRAYLPLLALFVLVKPNTGLIALALAVHYGAVRGPRAFLAGAALSLAVVAAGIVAGALYFGQASIWLDWYRYTLGLDGTLVYTAREGNLSLVKMIAQSSHLPVALCSLAVAVLLAAGAAAALTRNGRERGRLVPGLRAVVADPWLCTSVAVVATFAVTPLLWPHYFVLALVPLLRFVRWRGRWDAAGAWALFAYVLMSRPLVEFMYEHARAGLFTLVMFSWTPLLAAMLAGLAAGATGIPGPERLPFSDKPLPGASGP